MLTDPGLSSPLEDVVSLLGLLVTCCRAAWICCSLLDLGVGTRLLLLSCCHHAAVVGGSGCAQGEGAAIKKGWLVRPAWMGVRPMGRWRGGGAGSLLAAAIGERGKGAAVGLGGENQFRDWLGLV